jgi:hypothetical protein
VIELPIRIESTLNMREHWAAKARRAKMHRQAAHWLCQGRAKRPALPVVVRLVRIAPRELDTDNLAGGFKAIRDGIADWLGINDNDCRVTWQYAQERGEPLQYAVRVSFE